MTRGDRRVGIRWPSVALVAVLLAAAFAFYSAGDVRLGAALAALALGLVTPLRLAAAREGSGGSDDAS